MDIKTQVDQIVDSLKPMLATHGKNVRVLEVGPEKIRLSLSGFCGGCGCSSDYVDGLKEMLAEHFPDTPIECELV